MAQETEYKLRKIQFTKALRGYSCEEVDTYLAYVHDRYGTLGKECSDLKKKMAVMAAGQNEFREDALREKERIAAEAEAVLQEKQNAAGKIMEDARRKAARILADAETAAAGILKKAEEEAEEILHRRQEEEESALLETGRKIAERNNAADRIVEEIDSFREEVFAMYAKHIEELERLAKITDAFYQTKEELADSAVSDAAEAAEAEIPADDAVDADGQDDAVYMSLEDATDSEEWDDPDGTYTETVEEPESDMLRIDWKKHRANRDAADAAETEEMAAKTLWEIADEAAERIDSDEAPEADMPDAQEEEYEDGYAAYASCEDETDTVPDDFALLTGEEYEENDEDPADDPAGAPADSSTEISEEDFLSDIASEYITPSRQHTTEQHEPAAVPAEKPKKAREAADLDELLTDTETRNVGLTGEFDIIFNSKKSAANVTEISRQPLVAAAKPDKPKKHSTK